MESENPLTRCWRIRPAQPQDLDALIKLEQSCFSIPWHSKSLEYDLTGHKAAHYWVAQTKTGEVIAYAAYWQMIDEAEITHIAVMPQWQRKGVARSLLQGLISQAEADHLTAIRLEVRHGNTAAQELYRQAGFQNAGCRRHYYSDNGEDAIIMLKNIGDRH